MLWVIAFLSGLELKFHIKLDFLHWNVIKCVSIICVSLKLFKVHFPHFLILSCSCLIWIHLIFNPLHYFLFFTDNKSFNFSPLPCYGALHSPLSFDSHLALQTYYKFINICCYGSTCCLRPKKLQLWKVNELRASLIPDGNPEHIHQATSASEGNGSPLLCSYLGIHLKRFSSLHTQKSHWMVSDW